MSRRQPRTGRRRGPGRLVVETHHDADKDKLEGEGRHEDDGEGEEGEEEHHFLVVPGGIGLSEVDGERVKMTPMRIV